MEVFSYLALNKILNCDGGDSQGSTNIHCGSVDVITKPINIDSLTDFEVIFDFKDFSKEGKLPIEGNLLILDIDEQDVVFNVGYYVDENNWLNFYSFVVPRDVTNFNLPFYNLFNAIVLVKGKLRGIWNLLTANKSNEGGND